MARLGAKRSTIELRQEKILCVLSAFAVKSSKDKRTADSGQLGECYLEGRKLKAKSRRLGRTNFKA
jgi:hypothetical protein